jgi:hypothetical protein
VVTRDSLPGASTFCRQVASLDELPFPDFRDYFEQLETLVGGKRLYITLPVEGSRGCAWLSPPHVGVPTSAGCAYCALNGIWQGYRRKSAARLAAEVEALSDRHRVLSILFTDTLWPLSPAHRAALARLNKDLRLFAELRPNLGAAAVRDLAHTRSWTIQFGVEALSTPLLRRMNRGVTAIQNLQALKLCEELGVAVTWNLMLEYPSSDAADVEATLRAIEFAWPFTPCHLTTFILQPDSRAAAEPRACSIRAVRDHPLLHALFPPKTSRVLRGIFLDFDGRAQQRKLWDPVRRQVALWQREYDRVRGEAAGKPILSYGDGGSFLLIRRLRPGQDPLLYRFGEKSRAVYLFCREHRSLRAIARKFACIEERHLLALLRSMVDQRLMFTEADRYLSLAVHDRDRPGV